jgi:hypothetical protein
LIGSVGLVIIGQLTAAGIIVFLMEMPSVLTAAACYVTRTSTRLVSYRAFFCAAALTLTGKMDLSRRCQDVHISKASKPRACHGGGFYRHIHDFR